MSFWSKIQDGFKAVGSFGTKVIHEAANIGGKVAEGAHKVVGVLHNVADVANNVANSEIGGAVLDFIPGGSAVRRGIKYGDEALGLADKALGYVEEGAKFINRVDDGISKIKDVETAKAFGRDMSRDETLKRVASSIQKEPWKRVRVRR